MRKVVIAGVAAVIAMGLAACGPTKIGPGADGRADGNGTAEARTLPKVVLPPSIRASKSYRCSDNSLLLAEWYSDDMSASVRTKQDGKPVRVSAPEAGGTMTADGGWSLKGSWKDGKVTFASPDHPKPMTCHV